MCTKYWLNSCKRVTPFQYMVDVMRNNCLDIRDHISHVLSFLKSYFIILRCVYLPLLITILYSNQLLRKHLRVISPLNIRFCHHSNYSAITEAGSIILKLTNRDTRYRNGAWKTCYALDFLTNYELITKCQIAPMSQNV